ncbi:MAG: roadblock/LC7 domain-containing protein [Anaerolineales bacterium]|jgi:predicted regulator of Ras-like GTPase activity (Roadblock/LC7/MglB family)
MAGTIATQLDVVLNNFERSVPHVQATAVVSTDGLVIASRLPLDVEEDRIGAMGAAILSISTRSGEELERGEMIRVLIEGTNGYILIRSIGEYAILVALVEKEVRLGLLFYEAKKCIQELSKIL